MCMSIYCTLYLGTAVLYSYSMRTVVQCSAGTVKHRILSRLYYFGYATFVWVGRELGGRKCGWEGNCDQRSMQTMHGRARVRGMLHACVS